MEIFYQFKIFGVHVYISSVRMKKRSDMDRKMRNLRKVLQRKKRILFEETGGECERCGQLFPIDGLEIHHIVPTSVNPGLATTMRNLSLVCHDCHQAIHQRKKAPAAELQGTVTILKSSNDEENQESF